MDTNELSTGQPKKIGGFATRMGLLIGTNIAVIALFTVARSLSLRSRSGATRSDDPCHQQESESS